MADKSSSVRVLQQHLRQAGERLSAGDLESATGHVEAALDVDPSSLAALTLRDRISRTRSVQSNAAASAHVDHGGPSEAASGAPAGRFVPTGVDPQSWMSFEGRIEERRFRSLLRSAQEAVERGDAVAARLAVEEARELRPDSPEVEAVSESVAALPIPAMAAESGSFVQSRTFRAAGMLVFGVTLMLALDWLRADPPQSARDTASLGRGAGAREPDILASVSRGQTEASILDRLPSANTDRPTAAPQVGTGSSTVPPPAQPASVAPPLAATPRPVAEGRAQVPTLPPGEVADDFVVVARVTAPAVVTTRPPEPVRGEIPDDFVAAPPVTTRSTVTAPTPAPPAAFEASADSRESASSAAPLGNVVRESSPAAALGNRSGGATAPAAAASAAVIPRDARSQVMSVVDGYTQAFGRLDARAARAVWPNVDERALSRAFNELESQSLTFSAPCDVEVQGARATASCRGTARYVVKVGNREPRTEPRTWDIRLSRSGDEWFIESVRVASR